MLRSVHARRPFVMAVAAHAARVLASLAVFMPCSVYARHHLQYRRRVASFEPMMAALDWIRRLGNPSEKGGKERPASCINHLKGNCPERTSDPKAISPLIVDPCKLGQPHLRVASPALPCSFTLNGGTAPPASLDGSAPRDATASSLSLTGSMPKGLPPIDTMAASAASLASLNSFTLSGAAMLASLLIFAQG